MFDFNDPSLIVQMCKFQAYIQKSHIVIKFPCSYFVEWKTINNRYSICTQKRVRTANDEAIFNQKLTFYTEMVFNTKKKQYYSKETFLVLNLVSKSRPDQVKLVGRVSVDLADVLNRKRYSEMTQMKLNYCSVQGSISFSIILLNKRDSNLSVRDLDRSAFTDYFSLNPINRMMVQESISEGYNNSHLQGRNNNNNPQSYSGYQKSTKNNYSHNYRDNSNDQYFCDSASNKVPTFAQVNTTQYSTHKQPYKPLHQQQFITIKQQDQQIVSFQNSQKKSQHQYHDKHQHKTIRTQSRQQSLIERLQERNFGSSHGERWGSQQRQIQRGNVVEVSRGNVVEVSHNQSKTDRQNFQQRQLDYEIETKIQKRMSNGSKSRTQVMNNNKFEEHFNNGHVNNTKRHSVFYKASTQSQMAQYNKNITSTQISPIPLAKPTSPPSYQNTITHKRSQGQLSQTSQYQNEKLLSIVQNLQRQKQQQQTMIQQLKAMVMGKNMKKKQGRNVVVAESSQSQNVNKIRQLTQQNKLIKQQMQGLRQTLQIKIAQLNEKQLLISEMNQKMIKLQRQLNQQQKLVSSLQQKYEQSRKMQQQYKYMWESMRLSASNQQLEKDLMNRQMLLDQNKQLMTKKSSKLLEVIRLPQPNNSLNINNTDHNNNVNIDYNNNLNMNNNNSISLMSQPQQLYSQQSIVLNSQPIHDLSVGLNNNQKEQQIRITITKDENIYQDMQKQNLQLTQRIRQLEEENQIYKQLLKQYNDNDNNKNNKNNNNSVQSLKYVQAKHTQQQQAYQDQQPITITFSKNNNIYQNYQNLQKQNDQLYKTIQALQRELQSYKQLLQQTNYPKVQKKQSDIQIIENGNQQVFINSCEIVQQQLSVLNKNSKKLESNALLKNMLTSLHNNNTIQQQNIKQKEQHQQLMDLVGETFKITITKDKQIYEQQQQENKQLSKRVIELQDQIEKYKQLINSQGQNNNGTYGKKQQKRFNTKSSLQREQQYQQQGFTIRLSKDNNIFQNQQQQLQQLNKQIIQLEDRLKQKEQQINRYVSIYGDLNKQVQYKISITRQQNIYQDQQKQIKQLLLTIDNKDHQIVQLIKRISILQHQLQQFKPSNNNNQCEIMISIKRDQNIYDQQQQQLRQLSKRVIQLEDCLIEKDKLIQQKEGCIKEIQTDAVSLRQRLEQLEKELNTIPAAITNSQRLKSINNDDSNDDNKIINSNNNLTNSPPQPCANCQFLSQHFKHLQQQLLIKINELQLNFNLLQQQKNMLEQQISKLQQQISTLQQQKFCYNSTQNQLKIQIQQLQEEIYQLSLQNQKLNQELVFVQQNYQLQNSRDQQQENYKQEGQQQRQNNEQQLIGVNGNYKDNNYKVHHIRQNEQITFSPHNQLNINLPNNNSNNNKSIAHHNHSHIQRQLSLNSSNTNIQYSKSMQNSTTNINTNNHMMQKILTPSVEGSQNVINTSNINININKQPLSPRQQQSHIISMLQQQNNSLKQSLTLFQQQIQQQQLTMGQLQQRISRLMYQKEILLQNNQQSNKQLQKIKQKQSQLRKQHEKQLIERQSQLIERQSQLKQRISQLQKQLNQQTIKSSKIQQIITKTKTQQKQLHNKQQQIQHLQQQLKQQNQSLTQLSISYQTLQQSLYQLQQQKQQQYKLLQQEKQLQVEHIRQQHQMVNKQLKTQLEQIQKLIMEKQSICQQNQYQLRARAQQIQQLLEQLNELKDKYQDVHSKYITLTQTNTQLQTNITNLKQTLLNYQIKQNKYNQQRHLLVQMIESMKTSKQQRQKYIISLLPLIENKLNQQIQSTSIMSPVKTQPLAKLVAKQIQKIKINIMRNHQSQQSSTNGLLQRNVTVDRNVTNNRVDAKTFAQKSALLLYLKPLEDLIKMY